MNGAEAFLEQYGLAAIFLIMLTKSIGVPIPIPGDVLMLFTAARAAQGYFPIWLAFGVILVALVAGSLVQYGLARGPGRGVLYRYGKVIGLSADRLDRASSTVGRGGPLAIAVSIITPGIRVVSVAACGLARVPLRRFTTGMVLGSAGFLLLHFALGYVGGVLLTLVPAGVPVVGIVAAVLVVGAVGWYVVRRIHAPHAEQTASVEEAFGAWQDAACPVCVTLGSAEKLVLGLTGFAFADYTGGVGGEAPSASA